MKKDYKIIDSIIEQQLMLLLAVAHVNRAHNNCVGKGFD
jgi:hypothetical protein